MQLNFEKPVNLANPRVDPTAGRGYVDDVEPTFPTQIAILLAGHIQRDLDNVDDFVAQNWGFNRSPVRPEERAELLSDLDLPGAEALAGVFGRDRVARLLVDHQRSPAEPFLVPEEPPVIPEEISLG